ncbi:MAG: DUF2029 domain-containing protein [Lachnospiraceae bacterium]|nr:DUF2029 domain-containing protein [Lachnospiraceae bacterium]
MKSKLKDDAILKISMIIIGTGTIIYWLIMIVSRGELLTTYFVNDTTNTYMDYFNMLANVSDLDPYKTYANYPPLVFCFLRVMYHMLPIMPGGDDGFILRNYEPAQLGYILFIITVLFCFIVLTSTWIKNDDKYKWMYTFLLLTSGPMIFTIERGNFIIVALIAVMFFLRYYDSDDIKLRILAYIALSVAAAIKTYPAVFGLFVVDKRRWKEVFFLVVSGAITFFAPFMAFGGKRDVIRMFQGIMISSGDQATIGSNYNFSLVNLRNMILEIFNINLCLSDLFFQLGGLVISVIMFMLADEFYKKVIALTLMCIWTPAFSYTYMLVLFIPILLILCTKNNTSKIDYFYGMCLSFLLCPIALPFVFEESIYKFPISYSTAILNIILLVMAGVLLVDVMSNKLRIIKTCKVDNA